MNSRASISALSLSLSLLAVQGCSREPSGLSTSHAVAIEDSVRTALAAFQRYAGAAQWDSLTALYSKDSRFRWIEEGRRGGVSTNTSS